MKTILCSRGQTHAGSCSNPAQKWTKAIRSTKARKNGVDWILIFSFALAKDEQGRISPLINRLSQRIPYFTRWQNKMQSRVDHAPHRNVDALVVLPTILKKKMQRYSIRMLWSCRALSVHRNIHLQFCMLCKGTCQS